MNPGLLGSHPALDFLNTTFAPEEAPIELIGDGPSFVEWLVTADLIEESNASKLRRRFGTGALDAAAAEARKVRQWAGGWISRWREHPDANYSSQLHRLNALLQRASCYREVLATKGGLQMLERDHIDSADELIALVAAQIALLVVNEEPGLVKRCAGTGCTLWFLDRTKAHRRLFCSATVCGNRAKVAAFRERQRAR